MSTDCTENDPFQCFGSSSESEEEDDENDGNDAATRNENRTENASSSSSPVLPSRRPPQRSSAAAATRKEENGIMTFHAGVEDALLLHVKKYVSDLRETGRDAAESVLEAIDRFCREKYWMMHVGDLKAKILRDALEAACDEHHKRRCGGRFLAVELGTYCGYSAVAIGRALRDRFSRPGAPAPRDAPARLYSFEADGKHARRAREIVSLAGLDDWVTVRESADVRDVVGTIRRREGRSDDEAGGPSGDAKIGFLFLDHDKDLYLSDLRAIETSGLLREGSVVVADNVLWAYIETYVEYVRSRAKQNVLETETVECPVEYSEQETEEFGFEKLKDGIEITKYKIDPSTLGA